MPGYLFSVASIVLVIWPANAAGLDVSGENNASPRLARFPACMVFICGWSGVRDLVLKRPAPGFTPGPAGGRPFF